MTTSSKKTCRSLDGTGGESRTAILYARVSTQKQADQGHSLDAQESKLRAWATLHGYTVADFYVDAGLSGGSLNKRPGVLAAIEHACRTRGVLVAYSLSRLARSTRDAIDVAERLSDCGANLASLSENIDTTTATGRFFFTLMAAIATLEREQTSERNTMVRAHLIATGKNPGGVVPYGYQLVDKQLVEREDEQRVVKLVRELRDRPEPVSYATIAATLLARGIKPRNGKKWSTKVLWNIARG